MLKEMGCGETVKSLKILKKLGEGTYGAVHLCEMSVDGEKVKVAVKETRAGIVGSQTSKEVAEEAELAYRMSRIGAGPRVYHVYAIKFPYKDGQAVYQYIFMKAFAGNLRQFLSSNPSHKDVMAVIPKALTALRRHLEAGVECYDVKPLNFVYERTAHSTTVRMIDYGFPHCTIENERRCVSESSCKNLSKRARELFVALAAQFLFQARSASYHPEWVTEAAERNRAWHEREKVAAAVIEGFEKNKLLRSNYQWYKGARTMSLNQNFQADLQLGALRHKYGLRPRRRRGSKKQSR